MKTSSFNIQSCCCICGLTNCHQANDHEKVQFTQLKELMMKNKQNYPELDSIKFSVKNKFFKLKKQVIGLIQKKEKSIIKWLDSFYFAHLQDELKLRNVSILCDILQNDLRQLPNKDVKKLVKTLQRGNVKKSGKLQMSMNSVEQDINEMLNSIEIDKIIQELNKFLKMQQLGSFSKVQNKLSKSTDSVKTCHSSSSNAKKQFEPQQMTPVSIYEWKHIKITHTLKTLQLNNRHITDHDMLKQIPIISTFTNIRQLQIRNNKITALSCSLIANQMKFLSMIDIRGNKVGDDGMQKIITNMNNLKALYISETAVTDKTGQLIAKYVSDLETLWAEHNHMTGESCIKISEKARLRLLSLIGNPISQQHKATIQSTFRSKGYINI